MPLNRFTPNPLRAGARRAQTQAQAASPEKEHTIFFGLDLGTTYSGLAWTSSKDPDSPPEVITSWPSISDRNTDNAKVASKIQIDGDGNDTWGYMVTKGPEVIRWFKLLLVEFNKLPEAMQRSVDLGVARVQIERHGLDPVDVVARYLTQLWIHAIEELKRSSGPTFVEKAHFHVTMTLPAIWDHVAQKKMKDAAERANVPIEGLAFVPEPESAAIATIHDRQARCDIEVRDSFVIMDCGGGTCDAISYQSVKKKPLELKEIVKGEGNLFGAASVDIKFKELLKIKCGEAWDLMSASTQQELFESTWEHGLKRRFDGELERTITLPHIDNYDGDTDITFTAEETAECFKESFDHIKAMVDSQCDAIMRKTGKPAKYVILVGGYGRSPYLFEQLVEHVTGTGETEVLQAVGDKPWTAIARGAAIHGLSLQDDIKSRFAVNISSRVARQSYGVTFDETFKPGRHAKRDREWDEVQGEWIAKNQMRWFLRIGSDVETKRPIVEDFNDCYEEIPDHLEFRILSSDADRPPRRYIEGEDLVQINTILKVDGDAIDWEAVPRKKTGAGKFLYYLKVVITMTCRGNAMHFEVRNGHNNTSLASEQVLVDFSDEGKMKGKFLRTGKGTGETS